MKRITIIPTPDNALKGTQADVEYSTFFGLFRYTVTFVCVEPARGNRPAQWVNIKTQRPPIHPMHLNQAALRHYLAV